MLTGRTEHVDRRRVTILQQRTVTLPLRPNICVVGSRNDRVVCVNGTGTLHGQIDRCFAGLSTRARGIQRVILRIRRFSCVITSDRFRTLILRYSLVGRRHPGCGVLLGSSGNCRCLQISPPPCSHLDRTGVVTSSNTHCVNPFVDNCTVGRTASRTGGVFNLSAYNHPLTCNGGNKRHPYLGRRVNRYYTPYANGIDPSSCTGQIRRTISFLARNDTGAVAALRAHVRGTTRQLSFRRTTQLQSHVHTVHHLSSGRGIIRSHVPRRSIVTLTRNDNTTYFRIFHFTGKRLASQRRFLLRRRRSAITTHATFLRRCCAVQRDIPPRIAISNSIRRRSLLRQ